MNTRKVILLFAAVLLALAVVAAILIGVSAISPQDVTNNREPPSVVGFA
jgi:ABC-type enterochelin transport system permease subunit